MNTKQIGDISVAQIVAKLIKAGKNVLAPVLSDNQRYDLVVESDGRFERLQCKTGRLKDGAVSFPTCSSSVHRGGERKYYTGQIETFAVYCPENDEVYMVPIEVTPKGYCSIRTEKPKNNQTKGIRWADEFKI